jgi:Rieske Fe-S protein
VIRFGVKRRQAVVNLTGGRTLVGELAVSWPWALRLRGAATVGADGRQTRIDGVVVVRWRAVEFVQLIG